jgi:hypothetical protein
MKIRDSRLLAQGTFIFRLSGYRHHLYFIYVYRGGAHRVYAIRTCIVYVELCLAHTHPHARCAR